MSDDNDFAGLIPQPLELLFEALVLMYELAQSAPRSAPRLRAAARRYAFGLREVDNAMLDQWVSDGGK
jgi:hypothetical protein